MNIGQNRLFEAASPLMHSIKLPDDMQDEEVVTIRISLLQSLAALSLRCLMLNTAGMFHLAHRNLSRVL